MTTTTSRGTVVASAIRQQIGLDSWLASSARDARWWTDDNGDIVFVFRFGSRYGLAKWCEITYKSGRDDYDIIAYKIHRNGMKNTLSIPSEYEPNGREYTKYEGYYAESLSGLIRQINLIGELS